MKTFKTLLLALIALPIMAVAQGYLTDQGGPIFGKEVIPVPPAAANEEATTVPYDFHYLVNRWLPPNWVEISSKQIVSFKQFYQGPVSARPDNVPPDAVPVIVVQFLGGEWIVLGWQWMRKSDVAHLHGELVAL